MSAPPAMRGNQIPIRSLKAIPSHATSSPSRAVNPACPLAAKVVITSVLPRLHRCARAVRTNGSQCVGIAAWKNAMVNPLTAMVVRMELSKEELSTDYEGSEQERKSAVASSQNKTSGCRDLNPGPPAPEAGALPS